MQAWMTLRRALGVALFFAAASGPVAADWCGDYRKAREDVAGGACAKAENKLRKLLQDRPKSGKNILCPGGLLEPMDSYCPRLYLAWALTCQGKSPEEVEGLLPRIDSEEAPNFGADDRQLYARLREALTTAAARTPTPVETATPAPTPTPPPTPTPSPTPPPPVRTPRPTVTAAPPALKPTSTATPTPKPTLRPTAVRTASPTPTPTTSGPKAGQACELTPNQTGDLMRARKLCEDFEYEKARPALEDLARACPDDAEVNLLLGICWAFDYLLFPGQEADAAAQALKEKAATHFARSRRTNPNFAWDRELYGPSFAALYDQAAPMQ